MNYITNCQKTPLRYIMTNLNILRKSQCVRFLRLLIHLGLRGQVREMPGRHLLRRRGGSLLRRLRSEAVAARPGRPVRGLGRRSGRPRGRAALRDQRDRGGPEECTETETVEAEGGERRTRETACYPTVRVYTPLDNR